MNDNIQEAPVAEEKLETTVETVAVDVLKKTVENATALHEKLNEELMKKAYLIDLNASKLDRLKEFYAHEVKWEWNQSIGVVEVMKSLEKVDIEKPLFKGLTIQAICFHLSKHTGTGHAAALDFLENLLKPFNDGLRAVNVDTDAIKKVAEKVQYLKMQIAASEQGLVVEKTPQMIDLLKEFA